MLRYLLQQNAETVIPISVLILFFSIILGVVLWMYRPGSKKIYQHIAKAAIDS